MDVQEAVMTSSALSRWTTEHLLHLRKATAACERHLPHVSPQCSRGPPFGQEAREHCHVWLHKGLSLNFFITVDKEYYSPQPFYIITQWVPIRMNVMIGAEHLLAQTMDLSHAGQIYRILLL